MTAADAAELAAAAGGVQRMGLIHYSPRYADGQLKLLVKEARRIFPNSFLTRDRQAIQLPYRDE